MKKTALAIFSVSLTAGTLYLAYSGLKDFHIKKMMGLWAELAKKQKKAPGEKHLLGELDKLYLWDIELLLSYTKKLVEGKDTAGVKQLKEKIEKRKILQSADLKNVEGLLSLDSKAESETQTNETKTK